MNITTRIVILGALLALAIATPAFGQGQPTLQGYSNEGGQIQTTIGSEGVAGSTQAPGTAASGDSSLPFTGLDVGLMAAAAVGLMALGLGLRRLARAPQLS
jgi:hypothetical protein